ncbi:MAG: hypothetical protein MMC33_005762 [Icmadophila ericetorum]|nr:hypothetical protein [Icmadophila ericetorum]
MALLQKYSSQELTTSLSFVGSLSIALCVALGLACVRISQMIGARYGMLSGVLMMGLASLCSGFTVTNLGGLFATAGILFEVGSSLSCALSNTLPVQWFSSRIGAANGPVKLGGGLRATIMAIVVRVLIDKVGISWIFRILGFVTLASGIPAAFIVRERVPPHEAPFVDLSLFKNKPFCWLFVSGAVGTFALFILPFFLPLFAYSIGLSASTGAGTVSALNACTEIGRLGAGFACDTIGSTNILLLKIVLKAISMLAIWPISDTIGPLVAFAALNGIANRAFLVTMPTAIGRMIGPDRAAVAMEWPLQVGLEDTSWAAQLPEF